MPLEVSVTSSVVSIAIAPTTGEIVTAADGTKHHAQSEVDAERTRPVFAFRTRHGMPLLVDRLHQDHRLRTYVTGGGTPPHPDAVPLLVQMTVRARLA